MSKLPSDPGALGKLGQDIKLVLKLMSDKRVPLLLKALPVAGFLWFVFPDFVPGPIDDTVAIFLASILFIELSPKDVVDELRNNRSGKKHNSEESKKDDDDVIEGNWRDTE